MIQADYEKALLVAASWQLALTNDINELLAVASVIRNWVVPKFQARVYPMREKTYHASYTDAIREFLELYPVRPLPNVNESVLVDPVEGLLLKVDQVYDCSLIDLTSSRAAPFGARYFGRSRNPSEFFAKEVLQRQDLHPLIGTFGSMQFHA